MKICSKNPRHSAFIQAQQMRTRCGPMKQQITRLSRRITSESNHMMHECYWLISKLMIVFFLDLNVHMIIQEIITHKPCYSLSVIN